MRRHSFALLAITAICLALLLPLAGFAAADEGDNKKGNQNVGDKINKHGRELIATAIANGESSITLLVATSSGAASSVSNGLRSLGADVRYEDGEIGYVRASVPVAKVNQAALLPGVLAADVDEIIPLDLPKPEFVADVPAVTPPGPTTPSQNPYMPTRDIGAPQFVAAHPTWDGRGVTIGILDTGQDLDHTVLQTTTTGERKIIDWVTFTDPLNDNDPTWIVMGTSVSVTGGSFTTGGVTYTGAPNGTFKFGVFREASLGSATAGSEYRVACGEDVNRNGVCGEKFAILWDGVDNVWVDSNADGSFVGEPQMQAYKKRFDIGHFGTDNPATSIHESVPFVVQPDAASNTVNVGIVSGAHGTHVAGIAAGNGFFGGAFNGAAPGAKIVSVRVCLFISGCTAHALMEGMIYAVKVAKVDTINMSIGGLPSLNDGNNARAILYNQLIDQYNVQMFISAGNSGPGVNTVGDPSVATKVMSIGASWNKDSALSNYGATVNTVEALHDFSSRGPREDGGFKPNVVAPGNAVSSVPMWQPDQCLATPCGSGYGMFNGTSMAAPEATGASALLISAAKDPNKNASQQGEFADRKPTAAELRQAMTSSARPLAGYQAHEQGFGLINVPAAWEILQHPIRTADISSAVATNTLLSGFLATPGIGTGIYDREGLTSASAPYTRTYTFKRNDGGRGTYRLALVGNDGSFAINGPTTITLRGGTPVTVGITVTPGAVGAHSALLTLDDATTPGIDYATMNTIIVSQPLNAANGYTATLTGSANKFEDAQPRFFFTVPTGTTALRVTVEGLTGRTKWFRIHPYGVPIDPSNTGFMTAPYTESRTTQVSPLPGTWEVGLAASRGTLVDPATFSVTATAYRVDFAPAGWTVDPASVGAPYDQTFSATNSYAPATIVTNASDFASTFSTTKTIGAAGPAQTVPISVRSGSTNLTVTLGGASDLGADLDLYVFDCHTGTCVLRGSSTGSTANERVSINNPASGTWIALIDPFAVPAGTTTYVYTDSVTNAAYGTVSASTGPSARATGATWDVPARGTAAIGAGAGRVLRSSVNARLDTGFGPILGSATITFNAP